MTNLASSHEGEPTRAALDQALHEAWQDVGHLLNTPYGPDALNQAQNLPGEDVNTQLMHEVLGHLASLGHSEEEARGIALGAAYMARARKYYDEPVKRLFTR